MVINHKCLNFKSLYIPADTWFKLVIKATLFFVK